MILEPYRTRNDTSDNVSTFKKVTKGLFRSLKSKDRQYNDQNKKDKGKNNDLQNITQKSKDGAAVILYLS
jgi:hypothetical protein